LVKIPTNIIPVCFLGGKTVVASQNQSQSQKGGGVQPTRKPRLFVLKRKGEEAAGAGQEDKGYVDLAQDELLLGLQRELAKKPSV
jgi:hypothetical protein